MAIILDHTIVPAIDKEASAEFFAHIFGLKYEGLSGHFAPIRVNETLTLDFDDQEKFEKHHYAFHLTEVEFDQVFGRIKAEGIPYGSGPGSPDNLQVRTPSQGGRNVYFRDPDGHLPELMTQPQTGR